MEGVFRYKPSYMQSFLPEIMKKNTMQKNNKEKKRKGDMKLGRGCWKLGRVGEIKEGLYIIPFHCADEQIYQE